MQDLAFPSAVSLGLFSIHKGVPCPAVDANEKKAQWYFCRFSFTLALLEVFLLLFVCLFLSYWSFACLLWFLIFYFVGLCVLLCEPISLVFHPFLFFFSLSFLNSHFFLWFCFPALLPKEREMALWNGEWKGGDLRALGRSERSWYRVRKVIWVYIYTLKIKHTHKPETLITIGKYRYYTPLKEISDPPVKSSSLYKGHCSWGFQNEAIWTLWSI